MVSDEPDKVTLRLSVIRKPAEGTRTVFVSQGPDTVMMRGDANVVFTCGGCRAPILDGVRADQVRNIVFRCNGCGCYNETLS